jgi:hypothetical protein
MLASNIKTEIDNSFKQENEIMKEQKYSKKKKSVIALIATLLTCITFEVGKHVYIENYHTPPMGGFTSTRDAPYGCVVPWQIGTRLEGHTTIQPSFVCKWDILWVDWVRIPPTT